MTFLNKKKKNPPITVSVQHTTMIDLTARNFTPLQIMTRSDMMTDVCSC